MATRYKRLSLPLEPEVDEVITRLSELTRASKAATIQGILKESLPALRTTVEALTLIVQNRGNLPQAIATMDQGMLDAVQALMQGRSNLQTKAIEEGKDTP